ncbi:MAG: 2-oxoacid:ferredoxin oxidoreductase subunit beta [Candidatus Freyarchaeota archaeon]|nr:2-oxoacid:ferredoxin oxidoreductase subunit beta [Candidatus Jordarchaeia archaeon]MBS7269092.1 2-oxoacid:ferredoxin oxidoreductase subunit beta [Candidatus Jordarchaeia archaeon]MBS7280713.1 2-oxoacid:ferredoxin oxidoreductase subunit beta [Candidatus Jordarchaeia archaeon]
MQPLRKYLREDRLPTVFCPGCGNGIIMNCTLRAIDELGINIDDIVFVSGIGCSGRIPGYINADSLHVTHGRAVAFATGIKLFNPDFEVIVFTGDGDSGAIGISHLVHAARRNIDINVISVNNLVYALTGSQTSPTTPVGAYTYTSPYGSVEGFFDLCELVTSAGASYVARWSTVQPQRIISSIIKGIQKKGFTYIEVISQCPTQFGRKNEMPDPKQLMDWFRERTVKLEVAKKLAPRKMSGKLILGEFADRDRPEMANEYRKLIEGVQRGTIKLKRPQLDWLELSFRE